MYFGQARGSKLIGELANLGIGECTQPKEYPPRRHPWFLDNGAFAAWKNGDVFDADTFMRVVEQATVRRFGRPDFIVVPDIVAGGSESARFSRMWVHRLVGCAPLYVALQDGMTQVDMDAFIELPVDGFFVGGTLEWKLANGGALCDWAHSLGYPVHVGRVGTGKRVRWAILAGADSVDSCVPLFSSGNLASFVREWKQPHLFGAAT